MRVSLERLHGVRRCAVSKTVTPPAYSHTSFNSVDRLDFSLAVFKKLFTICLFEGTGHLISEFAGFDMRVMLADDFLRVVERSGSGRMA